MKLPALVLSVLFASSCTAAFASNPTPPDEVRFSMVQTASQYPHQDGMPDRTMLCSGFVVDASHGLALTAEHCIVEDQVAFTVDGLSSEVVRKSKWLALVRVPVMSKPPLPIAENPPSIGEDTFGFGWAFGKVFLRMPRQVVGYDGTDLVVGGAFIEGMSGGPIVNAAGEVVGLVQGGVPAASWLSGVDEIRAFLKGK